MVTHLGELTEARSEGVRHRRGNSAIRGSSTTGREREGKCLPGVQTGHPEPARDQPTPSNPGIFTHPVHASLQGGRFCIGK